MRAALLLALALATSAAQAETPAPKERVVHIEARKFSYSPDVVELRVGEPVILEFTSIDRSHGFAAPDLDLRADIKPGETVRLKLTPSKAGTFPFHCDVFCGSGHEEMEGKIVVKE
jgi:cytochrome c oxidase subunit 2